MKPYKVQFYVYASSEEEVQALESAMRDFVKTLYNKGVLVTAHRMMAALRQFGTNLLVTNFLKKL